MLVGLKLMELQCYHGKDMPDYSQPRKITYRRALIIVKPD